MRVNMDENLDEKENHGHTSTKARSNDFSKMEAPIKIGTVYEVGQKVLFYIEPGNESTTSILEVGNYVLVKHLELAILGQISKLALGRSANAVSTGEVELLATINLETCSLVPGVSQLPSLGSTIYTATESLVQELFEPTSRPDDPLIYLANLNTESGIKICLSPDMLFQRHCAILGSTGSGKSNTVSRALEECLKFKSKIILIDATGEYRGFKGKSVRHVHVGKLLSESDKAKNSVEVSVPYYHLTESDLMTIFRPSSSQGQTPKLRAAMKSLKLSILSPSLALDGNIIKADKDRRFYDSEYARHSKTIDNPLAIFDISKLCQQIENECVRPTRSPTEPFFWGAINSVELANCTTLVVKISDIISSPELSCIFNPGNLPSLLDQVDEFLADPQQKLFRISLEGLPFMYNAREIVCNAIGRQILNLARANKFKKCPITVVVDEAHHFVKENLENDASAPNIDSMALIAKEGRKYGLSICLATQRPRDIPESILSQMGTFLIHRLSNESDRRVVESASGSSDSGTLRILPTLRPGKCVILGVAVPFPLLVQVVRPEIEPMSETPSFSDFWRN